MKKLIAVSFLSVMALVGCQNGEVANIESQVADLQSIIGEQEMTITDLQEQVQVTNSNTRVNVDYEVVDIEEGPGPTEYYLYADEGYILYGDDLPEDTQIGDKVTLSIHVEEDGSIGDDGEVVE